jgi:hypothetical protein
MARMPQPGAEPTPLEIALHDQATAHVRDLNARGIPVVFADLPRGATCISCPSRAVSVLRILPVQPGDNEVPACGSHYESAMNAMVAVVAHRVATEDGA